MAETAETPIGVVGLGLMGGTFAGHLLDAGLTVIGSDPEPARQQDHQSRGGEVAELADLATRAETILYSLPNSTIALEVSAELARARSAAGTGPSGLSLVIDATTGRPEDAVESARILAEAGVAYVDATVSGNAASAAARDLVFMAGGADTDVARAGATLNRLGRSLHHLGPVGAGARAKLVVNHVLSIHRAAMAEGLTVAEKAGIDLDTMLAVLMDSAAYSKAMDLWGQRMVAGDHERPNARIAQTLKDSHLINDQAEGLGASRDLVAAVLQVLLDADEGGLAAADNSAVMEVMRRRAGIGRVDRP